MAGTLIANTINTDTGVFTNLNALNGVAKAWVNFVGTTATINGSFNVSSVTRSSTGVYVVNFTTAMPNANYAVSPNAMQSSTLSSNNGFQSSYGSLTTTSVTLGLYYYNGTPYDAVSYSLIINGA